MALSKEEMLDLRYAHSLLEEPGLSTKITGALGVPVEKGFDLLPRGWRDRIATVTRTSLGRALDAAVYSIRAQRDPASGRGAGAMEFAHKLAAGATGAAGGAFGIAALAVELPVSTTIMLRSIAVIAMSEGQDPAELRTRLDCLEVFALGSRDPDDDGADSAYFMSRAALGQAVSEAAAHVARHGLASKNAPAMVRLINAIAGRFGLVVSEKAAAQSIPLVGAAGGAVINALFLDHFQNTARGHFIVRRLEQHHGEEAVREAYRRV